MATELTWTDTDRLAVDTARVLAADAVEKTGNGHPGTAISLAPLGYLLYHKVMSIDPSDPNWLGRDRFIMSAGHSSLTQYTQLYLAGLGLELSDLESLRTWGSLTPGHPEYGLTKFVETTTGPLGAGVANAVGMAMAARRERGLLDPDAAPGTSLFDHYIYAIAGDGCTAVTGNGVNVVVEEARTGSGVRVEQAAFTTSCHGHADGVGNTGAQRAGRGLDKLRQAIFGVAGSQGSPGTQGLQVGQLESQPC